MQFTRLIRSSLALFWLLDGLVFLLYSPAQGRPQIPDQLPVALLALLLSVWCLSGVYWRACCYAQLIWLLVEPPFLAAQDFIYLVHPLGLASKNLPIALLLILTLKPSLERRWVYTAISVVWLTEGFFPKMLFQQQIELSMAEVFLGWVLPSSLSLYVIGAAQVTSGVLVLSNRWQREVLALQFVALFALPFMVIVYDPGYALFPFAPLWKNLPIIAGTYWLLIERTNDTVQA